MKSFIHIGVTCLPYGDDQSPEGDYYSTYSSINNFTVHSVTISTKETDVEDYLESLYTYIIFTRLNATPQIVATLSIIVAALVTALIDF